jgi:hypothetical protein
MDWSPTARTVQISPDEYDRVQHLPLRLTGETIGIGDHLLSLRDSLVCGDMATVSMEALAGAALRYHRLTRRGRTPQLAALLFDATGDMRFLSQYFPLAHTLGAEQQRALYALTHSVATHPNLAIALIGEGRADLTAQLALSARYLVAGAIVEALWGRHDLLRHLLSRPRYLRLFSSELALEERGDLLAGAYHRAHRTIDLALTALYTGFYTEMPGVTPILHGLGHLLDDCDGRTAALGAANGMLLGLNRHDGALRTPRARELFLTGKRVEIRRYERFRGGIARMGDVMPVGQPRLFTDDSTFAAGYFELFFRTPHYFSAQNPALFEAYAALLHQDPRRYWARDCAFYVDQSRAQYTAPLQLPLPRLSVPPGWWPF